MVLYRIATNSLFTWKETLAMHKQFLYWYMSPVFYNTNWTQTKATRSPYFAQTKWMVKQLLAPLMKLCQRDACWLFTVCQHNSVSICCQVGVIGEMWQILGNHAPYALNYTHAMHHDSITPFIIKTSSKTSHHHRECYSQNTTYTAYSALKFHRNFPHAFHSGWLPAITITKC